MPSSDIIVAVITTNKKKILFSGPPVFYAKTREEMEKTALLLSKTTMAMIHDLENECLVIVKH
ncbi:hypothetical protein GC105_09430 [Alkalibaculum sp. M08DMB]|uniref:Uncharacterized protein n=1 Tax=Alkalibaculum sporogenes TaxID=2655001 RepID=A0A6A7K9M5_9FIRM|nr:hypothetical protein [Alkalibaculum sporogenes]MPW26011.1 hypothetical protein [Alkalibaculum sporogenes]